MCVGVMVMMSFATGGQATATFIGSVDIVVVVKKWFLRCVAVTSEGSWRLECRGPSVMQCWIVAIAET